MRIGTWNLEGRWSRDHLDLLIKQGCDIWLLTEVPTGAALPGFDSHLTNSKMASHKHWAGVFSQATLGALPDPHPASAAAMIADWCVCSSILPWRSCGLTPWCEGTNAEKTERAVDQLLGSLPSNGLVWGGDWNHAMQGRESVGSLAGRSAIRRALADRRLKLATENSPHRIDGLGSIDHIAIPETAQVVSTDRIVAATELGQRLSDHDAYVIVVTTLQEKTESTGGGYEIRTREGVNPTRFPSERHRPLGESSVGDDTGTKPTNSN